MLNSYGLRIGGTQTYEIYQASTGSNLAIGTNYSFINFGNTSSGEQMRLIDGSLGIGVINPSTKLDISGSAITIKNGNAGNSFTGDVIRFGYSITSNYAHNIKSRHNAAGGVSDFFNAIDFCIWNSSYTLTQLNNTPTFTITGNRISLNNPYPQFDCDISGSYIGRCAYYGTQHDADKRNNFSIGRSDGVNTIADTFTGL